MSTEFILNAEARALHGKGASRRLRRLEQKVPAILYGAGKDPQSISLAANELKKATESEAFYASVLTLNLDGESVQAVVKDMQRHPAKGHVMHADFQRVDANQKLHMNVPLHFMNEEKCKGVKLQGGLIAHQMSEVEIVCYAKDLPEFIEVDMEAYEVGTTLHLTDIVLPEGVEIAALMQGDDHDLPIVSVNAPKGSSDDDEADSGDGEAAAEGEEGSGE